MPIRGRYRTAGRRGVTKQREKNGRVATKPTNWPAKNAADVCANGSILGDRTDSSIITRAAYKSPNVAFDYARHTLTSAEREDFRAMLNRRNIASPRSVDSPGEKRTDRSTDDIER